MITVDRMLLSSESFLKLFKSPVHVLDTVYRQFRKDIPCFTFEVKMSPSSK